MAAAVSVPAKVDLHERHPGQELRWKSPAQPHRKTLLRDISGTSSGHLMATTGWQIETIHPDRIEIDINDRK